MPSLSHAQRDGNMDGNLDAFASSLTTGQVNNLSNLTASNSIPVELISFDVVTYFDAHSIVWSTSSEFDNSHFELEYAYGEPQNFSAIDRVDGSGTTMNQSNYGIDHFVSTAGTHYYRLRQVATDGTSTLIDVAIVEAKGKSASAF